MSFKWYILDQDNVDVDPCNISPTDWALCECMGGPLKRIITLTEVHGRDGLDFFVSCMFPFGEFGWGFGVEIKIGVGELCEVQLRELVVIFW